MTPPFHIQKKVHPPLGPLTVLGYGDHLCGIYRTDEEYRAVITAFIRQGIERDEKVISIIDARRADQIFGYLRDEGVDPDQYTRSGQLEILTVEEFYLHGGVFDPEVLIKRLTASTEAAVSEGYSGLRVAEEVSTSPGVLPKRDLLMKYETLLETFLQGSRCLMICLYDRRSVPSDLLPDILMIHPYAVIGTELIDNFYFIPPDESDRRSVLPDHWIENLKVRDRLIRTLKHEKEVVEMYLDVAGVMIVSLDTKGTVVMANQKTVDILGIPKSDIIGENWFDRAIPKRLRDEVRRVHSRLIDQNEAADLFFDNPVITSSGVERIIAWYNTLLLDDTGLVIGTLSSGEDVTDLRHAEDEAARQHDALLESEHRLSDIIDFLPDATFAIDDKGVVIAWNHAIEAMTGVSAEEMIGKGEYAYAVPFYGERRPILIDLVFKDDAALRSQYKLLNEMPGAIEAETKYARPKREDRILLGRVSSLRDRKGNIVGAIETIRDITERKIAVSALEMSEIRYRRLFEAAKDGVLILDEDDGTIIDANPFILEILGYRLDEVIGRTVSEIGFIRDTTVAEEVFLRLKEVGYIRYDDLPLETKDGRQIEVEFVSNRYAINDHSVIQCNIRDITERKHAELALRLSESLQHLILAAIPDILIRSDADGRYLDILTPEDDRFILPKADLIGKTASEVTSEEIGMQLTDAIHLALDKGEMQTIDYTLTVPAGRHHFEARIVPYLKDEVLTLIRDVTVRKEAIEALHERIKELGCLYRISELIEESELSEEEVLQGIADLIPSGFLHPEITMVRITINDTDHQTSGFQLTSWTQSHEIFSHHEPIGRIVVSFMEEYLILPEESVLLRSITEQIGRYIDGFRREALLNQKNEQLTATEEELRSQLEELVANQLALRESQEFIRTILDNLPIGVAVNSVDPEVHFEYFNQNFLKYYRTTSEALKRPDAFWDKVVEDLTFREELKKRVLSDIASGDPDQMRWDDIPITRRGEETTFISAMNIPIPGKQQMISTVWDVTKRKRAEDRIRFNLTRTQLLLALYQMGDAPEEDLFHFTLNSSLIVSESRYAFIGLMNDDESEMILYSWSEDVMKDCYVTDNLMHLPVASGGILGECIRKRAPAVFNDYSALHQTKKGYPKGHIEITRYLGVPIFDGTRIVAVLSVANKEGEYQDDDIDALMALGNMMWGLIRHKQDQKSLMESEERYRSVTTAISDFAYSCVRKADGEYTIDWIAGAVLQITGYTIDEVIAEKCWGFFVHPDDQKIFLDSILSLPQGTSSECELRIVHKDGEIRWLSASTRCVLGDAGEGRLYGGCRDITKEKLAREELRVNHEFLSKVMEILPIGLWFADKEGKLFRANPAGAAIWGAAPFVGFEEYSIFHARRLPSGEEIAPDDWALARTLREGVTITDELLEIDAFDGEKRIILNYTAPVILDDGSMVGAIIVNHDVTEEVHAKEALLESEQHFRTLADSGQALIWTANTEKKCDYFNKPWLIFTGRTFEEEFGDGWTEGVHPDDLDRCVETFVSAFDRRERFSMAYRIRRYDGEYRWIQDDGSPRYDTRGQFIGYIGHCLDITDRKIAEDSLRESEERFRRLAENAEDIIYRIDLIPKPHFTYVNPAVERISGYTPEEHYNDPYLGLKLVHPDDRHLLKSIGSDDSLKKPLILRWVRKDGEVIWIEQRHVPVYDEAGTLVAVEGIARDITGEKLVEEERKKTVAQIEENIYRFSILNDQIRNPLTVIMALADLDGGEYSDKIMDQVKAIDRIIALLDQGVLESESTRAFMKRHNQISDNTLK